MKLRFVIVFVLFMTGLLVAQTFRGTILGTVTDPSGYVVAGATVKVRNVGTGLERTTTTSADGSYSFPELPIGTYTVTVTQPGFQAFVATGVTVNVATDHRVDAALKTGQVATKVEVSAEQLPHGGDDDQRSWRRDHGANGREHAGERPRLHEADLPQSRRRRIS